MDNVICGQRHICDQVLNYKVKGLEMSHSAGGRIADIVDQKIYFGIRKGATFHMIICQV